VNRNALLAGVSLSGIRLSICFVLVFLGLLLPTPGAAQEGPIVITGRPGDILVETPYPLSIRSDPEAKDGIQWHVITSSNPAVPPDLQPFLRQETIGLRIVIPGKDRPSLVWSDKGLRIVWGEADPAAASTPPAAIPPRDPGDPFLDRQAPVYPLGPGDTLRIVVYNVDNMDLQVTVDPKGNITLPLLDKVPASGQTVNSFQQELETAFLTYVKKPEVSVQVLEYESRYVNVLGEVVRPGRIAIKGALRVLDAVSQAGGYTDRSGDIEVQRRLPDGEMLTRQISRDALMTGEKNVYNFYLHDQDVIHVKPVKSIYVSGEVMKPGSFPFNEDITLLKAVALAGGFSEWAKKRKVDILRERSEGGTETLTFNAADIEKGKAQDPALKPNDHIVVKERKLF